MKERPILFSGPMVRAILEGRKTMTRRVMKIQPPSAEYRFCTCISTTGKKSDEGKHHWVKLDGLRVLDGSQPYFPQPYGLIGDRLWVRETWAKTFVYQAGREWVVYREEDNRTDYGGPWKPSIFMPRWASRITLEIVSVRVERLQEISEEDAEKEGAEPILVPPDGGSQPHVEGFRELWESINGAGSWSANPWVWVVEFKAVQP